MHVLSMGLPVKPGLLPLSLRLHANMRRQSVQTRVGVSVMLARWGDKKEEGVRVETGILLLFSWYFPTLDGFKHEVLSNPCETPPKPRVPKTWSRKPWSHSSPCQSAFAPALLRKTYLCTVLPYHKYRYKRVNLCTEYPPAPMPHLQPCACDFIHRIRCLQIQAVPIRSGTPVPLR